jgi:hypothetical protein
MLSFQAARALQRRNTEIQQLLRTPSAFSVARALQQERAANFVQLGKPLTGGKDDHDQDINAAAHTAATSEHNDTPPPTDAQAKAGTYQKGAITLHGMAIRIENPNGSTRSGQSPDGQTWSVVLSAHYGEIVGTLGADHDPVDIFIGPSPDQQTVYVIDQYLDGTFDEHKAMVGYRSPAQAKAAYLASFTADWSGLGAITAMSMAAFKAWVYAGKKQLPAATAVPPQDDPFLAQYRAGEFYHLPPGAFTATMDQANAAGLPFDDNKAVVLGYLDHHRDSISVTMTAGA